MVSLGGSGIFAECRCKMIDLKKKCLKLNYRVKTKKDHEQDIQTVQKNSKEKDELEGNKTIFCCCLSCVRQTAMETEMPKSTKLFYKYLIIEFPINFIVKTTK